MKKTTDHANPAVHNDACPADWPEVSPPGEEFTRRAVTGILAMIAVMTFTFSFGNTWALGVYLGVPA